MLKIICYNLKHKKISAHNYYCEINVSFVVAKYNYWQKMHSICSSLLNWHEVNAQFSGYITAIY